MRFVVALVAIGALAGPAHAQATNPPTLQKPDLNPQTQPDPALPSTGESLSERLNRSDGVIAPPRRVDPEIAVPPKDPSAGSSMPVIRPGDRSVEPK